MHALTVIRAVTVHAAAHTATAAAAADTDNDDGHRDPLYAAGPLAAQRAYYLPLWNDDCMHCDAAIEDAPEVPCLLVFASIHASI